MKKSTLTLLLFLFSSCGKASQSEDLFYLRSSGADMPVYVRGNKESKKMLIWLHGGPGGSSVIYVGYSPFTTLEKDFMVVYWDQRGSGQSLGDPEAGSLTPQFVADDLNRLLILLESKYGHMRSYIAGHSLGGYIAAKFIANEERQNKVSGAIFIGGSIGEEAQREADKRWQQKYAGTEFGKNGGYSWAKPNLNNFWDVERIFFKPTSMPRHLANASNPNLEKEMNSDSSVLPIFSSLHIPSLFLAGRHDGRVPAECTEQAYQQTASKNKKIVYFENSAHYPFLEESEKFVTTVKDFLSQ